MSRNIVDYILDNQLTFSEVQLNEIDSLILSSLAYLNYESAKSRFTSLDIDLYPANNNIVSLHDILSLTNWDDLVFNCWLADSSETTDFLRALQGSRRFMDVEVAFYRNESSSKIEKQFCAMTYLYKSATQRSEDDFAYVAFRGTDGTFSGWKEDFNLAYMPIIPSQRSAENYLSGICDVFSSKIYVGGHSKGGNLAEYASLCCSEKNLAKIEIVYNHDGPSFLELPNEKRYLSETFQNLHSKTVPESSIIGMILEEQNNYTVVQSTSHSVFQHNPFSWIVQDNEDCFEKQSKINMSAKVFDSALDNWLKTVDIDTRGKFIDTLYSILNSASCDKFSDFQKNIPSNIATIIRSSKEIDKDTRDFLLQLLGDFVKTLVKN